MAEQTPEPVSPIAETSDTEGMTNEEYEDWKVLQEVLDERAAEWWRENQEDKT